MPRANEQWLQRGNCVDPGQSFCGVSAKKLGKVYNSKNNGTDRQYESLQKSNAKSNDRSEPKDSSPTPKLCNQHSWSL
jgi:hypothetical protein